MGILDRKGVAASRNIKALAVSDNFAADRRSGP
jgi:hypothetical protein